MDVQNVGLISNLRLSHVKAGLSHEVTANKEIALFLQLWVVHLLNIFLFMSITRSQACLDFSTHSKHPFGTKTE